MKKDAAKKICVGIWAGLSRTYISFRKIITITFTIPLIIAYAALMVVGFLLVVNFISLVIFGGWPMSRFREDILYYTFNQVRFFIQPLWNWITSLSGRLFS